MIFDDIRQTADGGYVVTGNNLSISNNKKLHVTKLDSTGNLLWQKIFGTGDEFQTLRAIWQTADKGYVVAGDTGDSGSDLLDVLVVKLDKSGNLKWQKTYGGSGGQEGFDIEQTTDGGYVVIANSCKGNIKNFCYPDIRIFKLFATGAVQWDKKYGGSKSDFVMQYSGGPKVNDMLRQTADGGYVFTGGTNSSDGDVVNPRHARGEVWLVKLDAKGNIDWQKTYGGSSFESGSSVQQTIDGGYLVAAASWSKNGDVAKNEGIEDFFVFKTDSLGRTSWKQSLGSTGNDIPADAVQDSGCGFVVTGVGAHSNGDVANTHGGISPDWWVIKFKVAIPPPATDSLHRFCWRDFPKIKDLQARGSDTLGFSIRFRWYADTTDISALADTTLLKNGKKYYLTQTIDGCESPYDSTLVNITRDILPTATSPQRFCQDEKPTLADILANGQDLQWYKIKPDTLEIPKNTPLQDGQTYYVSQSIDNCESSLLPIEVVVSLSPDAFPLPTITVCDTDSDGAGEFFLPDLDNGVSGGATNVSVTYHPSLSDAEEGTGILPDHHKVQTSPETIYARVLDTTTGCDSIVELLLKVAPVPTIANLEDLSDCEEGPKGSGKAIFELTQNNDIIIGSQEPQHLKITYHENQADAENGDNAIPNPENYISGPTTIFVRLENEQTNCFDTGSFELNIFPRPNIANISIQEEVCSDLQGGNVATMDLTTYDGQINPGSPANTSVVYYANAKEHAAGNPIESPESYTTTSNPQTIVAEVVDTNTGCPSLEQVEITITVNDRPLVDLSSYEGMALCWDSDPTTPVEGGNYQPIVLETGLNANECTFEWSLDGSVLSETSPNIEATEPGVYKVIVSDTDGTTTTCTSTASATIIQANPPEFDLLRTSQAVANEHGILVSNISGKGNFAFRLDDGPWLALGDNGTLLFEKVAPGTHLVYGRSMEDCGTTLHTITLIGYPKFFTPNNDGQNDRWNLIGLKEQPQSKILIFDRYGKLLESLNPAAPGWDGTYNGRRMPSNDYWFQVGFVETLPDGTEQKQEFVGHFTLKR